MEQPLVSVIVPVYNASSHVARCPGEHPQADL